MELGLTYRAVFFALVLLPFIIKYIFNGFSINNKLGLIFVLLALLIEITFRQSGGTDYSNYKSLWDYIVGSPDLWRDRDYFEIGFLFYMRLLSTFSDSIFFYQFVTFLIPAVIFYIISRNLRLEQSIFVLVLYSSFIAPYYLNVVGQGLAIAFFLLMFMVLTIPRLFERSKAGSILLVSLSLHKSAIFASALFLNKRDTLILLIFVGAIISALLIYFGLENLVILAYSLGFGFSLEYDFEASVTFNDIAYRFAHLIIILFFAYVVESNSRLKYAIWIYIFGFLLFLFLIPFPVVALRTSLFFRSLELIIYPLIGSEMKHLTNRGIFSLALLAIYSVPFYLNWSNPLNLILI